MSWEALQVPGLDLVWRSGPSALRMVIVQASDARGLVTRSAGNAGRGLGARCAGRGRSFGWPG
jgi:hypothetical protein